MLTGFNQYTYTIIGIIGLLVHQVLVHVENNSIESYNAHVKKVIEGRKRVKISLISESITGYTDQRKTNTINIIEKASIIISSPGSMIHLPDVKKYLFNTKKYSGYSINELRARAYLDSK